MAASSADWRRHHGEPNDRNNLSEKWEATGLLPALDPTPPCDYFRLVANDNDFATHNGFQAKCACKGASGVDVDTIFLIVRVALLPQPK